MNKQLLMRRYKKATCYKRINDYAIQPGNTLLLRRISATPIRRLRTNPQADYRSG